MTDREKPRYVSTSYGVNPPFGPTTSGGDISAAALGAPSGDVERQDYSELLERVKWLAADYDSLLRGWEFEFASCPEDHEKAQRTIADVCAALSAMPDRQAGINEGLEMAAKDKAAEFWFSLGFASCYGRLDKPPFPLEEWRGAFEHVDEAYDGDLAEDFATYVATAIETGEHLKGRT